MLSYIAVGTGAAIISPPLITAVAHLLTALRGSSTTAGSAAVLLEDAEEDYEVAIQVCQALGKVGRRDSEDLRIAKEMLQQSVDALDKLYDRYHDAKEKYDDAGWYAFWTRFDNDKWHALLHSQNGIVEKRMNLVLKLR